MNELLTTAKPGPTFDAESMRAILAGRKTQTRRLLKGANESAELISGPNLLAFRFSRRGTHFVASLSDDSIDVPYRPGVYYARESLYRDGIGRNTYYMADGSGLYHESGLPRPWLWKCRVLAPHLMPRWAARVWLRITDVRVQRLEDIDPRDCVAEGVSAGVGILRLNKAFESRWERVNKPGSWERDRMKWVAAYTFETMRPEV